jgi:WD40 repeat protein/DNA-binding SARP family transcriptional activator
MGIDVLGPLRLDGGAIRLGSRDRVVLAALAMRPGEVVSAEVLAEAIWDDAPPPSWNKNLQSCIVRLRKMLGPEYIETSARGYRLAVPTDSLDSARFERLIGRGRELLGLGEPERAAYAVSQALLLWRGDPLTDLDDWDRSQPEIARLCELRLTAEELWLDASLRAGHHLQVLAEAQAMAGSAPLRERRWQLLALAQYQSGQQAEALQTLHQVRRMLVHEMGLDPSADLDAMEQAILRHDPSLLIVSSDGASTGVCPYRGLSSFDIDDADAYFGRERVVAACLTRIGSDHPLVLVGPSGSGKSSLVRAGVGAALRRDRRSVAVIIPGAHPMDALDDAVRKGPPDVLVVDQAENVFVQCGDAPARDAFLRRLAALAESSSVIVAMRADRMGDVSAHADFARMVERGLYVLTAMEDADLRAAIEQPARQAGLVVEAGLVDLLVRDVQGEPGALPLLSHALRETWLRREGRTLTVEGYEATGGIRGAVAQSAEDVYGRIEPSQRALLRDLMLRLVSPGAEGEAVRARVPRRLVAGDPERDALIELLVGSRLVTSDDGVIELAHEALARAWPRLRGWLEDDVDGQRILHHLGSTAAAWDVLDRPSSELYRGSRLTQALEWRDRPHPELTSVEVEFLDASAQLEHSEARAAAGRARLQTRLIRRLQALLAAGCVLLVLALVASLVAVGQKKQADANRQHAQAAESAAVAGQSGARALATDDVDVSMLLAATAVELDDTPQSRANLQAALAKRSQLLKSIPRDDSEVGGLEVSPDGRNLAVMDVLGTVSLYDTTSWQVLASYTPHAGPEPREKVGPLAFSPDGRYLAVGMPILAHRPVRLLDARTLKPLDVRFPGVVDTEKVRDRALDLAFSRDGRTLAATCHEVAHHHFWDVVRSALVVWRFGAPRRPSLIVRRDLPGRTYQRNDRPLVALAPDASRVFVSQPFSGFALPSGRRIFKTNLDEYEMEVSPNGRLVALANGPDILIADARTGLELRTLHGQSEDVTALQFGHRGSVLASSGFDQNAIVWNADTGAVRERLALSRGSHRGLAFSPDDGTLYTAGSDGSLRVWDLAGDRRYIRQVVPPGEFGFGWEIPSPDGRLAVHATTTGTYLLDVTNGHKTPFGRQQYNSASWTSDGRRLALLWGGLVQVWDPRGPTLLRSNRGFELRSDGMDIGYTADDERLLVAGDSGSVSLLDAETLRPAGVAASLGKGACCVAGIGDSRAFALTGGATNPRSLSFEWGIPYSDWSIVDVDTGRLAGHGELGFGGSAAGVSPDGKFAAIGGDHGEMTLLDLETDRSIGQVVRSTHSRGVAFVRWSGGGTAYASAGYDGSVALWDGATGTLVGRFQSPEHVPTNVAFAPDGHTLVVVTYTDAVYVWDTAVDHMIDFACGDAGRNLTLAEWADEFGDRPYIATCPQFPSRV